MKWKDIGKMIGKAAPLLGSLLGGPAGGAVGTLVAAALGVEDTEEAVVNALKADPDALVKLKELEMKHKEELEKMQIDKMKIDLQTTEAYLADTQNARSREKALVQSIGRPDYHLYALAWSIIIGFIGLIVLLSFHVLPEDSNGVIFMLFGALAAAFGQVIQYFFGSSESSKLKTKLMQHTPNVFGKKD